MFPYPIRQVLQGLRHSQSDLSAEIDQLRPMPADSLPQNQLVKSLLMRDTRGVQQLLFPASGLIAIDRLNARLDRSLSILPSHQIAARLRQLSLTSLPVLPISGDTPPVVDTGLLTMERLYLETGVPGQVMPVSSQLFQALLGKFRPVQFTSPVDAIPINRDDPEHDLDQINTAIGKFTQRRIQQRLEDTLELPPLPETAQRILHLRLEPNASVSELAEIVERDPSLSAQVVSWASSSYYGARGRIRSVHDAIMWVLGFDLVMNLAMGLALGRSLKLPKDSPAGYTPYWHQAVWMATTASILSTLVPRDQRPEFGLCYLAGLLHNFGYLVLAHVFPPHFSLICRHMECNPHLDTAYVEHYLLGITREQIGSQLMALWNMPPEIVTALRHQKNPDYQGEHQAFSGLLFIATQLLRKQGVLSGPAQPIPPELYQRLGLDPAKVAEALNELLLTADELTAIATNLAVE